MKIFKLKENHRVDCTFKEANVPSLQQDVVDLLQLWCENAVW